MAQINMNGRPSFLLNDIKQVIRNGGNVTHILNVKVSRERSPDEGNRIRAAIFRALNNVPIALAIRGVLVTITWRTAATMTSAYYHADADMFNDLAVKRHTKILLGNILNSLDAQFGNVFSSGVTGIAFIVAKPLTKEVVLVEDDDDVEMPAQVEPELDEAIENI